MTTTVVKKCDVCGKDTEQIVAKLYYIPIVQGVGRKTQSNYTHHLDIGQCCSMKGRNRFIRMLRWRERKTKAEYAEARRNGN